jgi:hemolysin activation/secretion protein
MRSLMRTPLLLAAMLAGLPSLAVHAQQAMPEATGATVTFPIRGFELSGEIPLSADETSRVLAPFIRSDGTLETLQKAGAALEAALKERGYALHRVTLPPQEVGKKVTFIIVKFVIGKVTIEGQNKYSQANIRTSIPELQEGQAPNFRTLAVQTAIANENPGKQLQVSLKESEEAEKIDVKLLVKETDPLSVSASLANTGSASTGRDRLTAVVNHANMFDLDQQLSFAYTTSPNRTDSVKQVGINYKIPLYAQRAVVGLSYTESNVFGDNGSFTNTGAGHTYGVNYNYYLEPQGGRRQYLTVGLDEKFFDASVINNQRRIASQPLFVISRPLSLGYTLRDEADNTLWGYNVEYDLNLPYGSGTSLSEYQNGATGFPDTRISTAQFSILKLNANFLTALSKGWLLGARGQVQYTSDGLISGEQFGLGGASTIRGVEERVASSDSGFLASVELTTPEFAAGLRALGFVDAGYLSNNGQGAVLSNQLASIGVGLHYNLPKVSLSAEWGTVVVGVDQNTPGTNPPKAGDQKLHVNMTVRF